MTYVHAVTSPDGAVPGPDAGRTPAPRGPGRRAHRRARRVLVWLAAAVVALTVASLLYNVATDGSASRPAGLTFVRTGNTETRYRAWGTAAGRSC